MTGGGATPDERRVVVNADDFGFSAGVNRGILEAHAAGVVSSVSVLVNTPGWPDARDRLRAIGGTLGVGLHLNLTTGAPLTTAPSLTTPPPIARFHSLAALVARALTGDRKSTRLNSSHGYISYAVFCLKKKSSEPDRCLGSRPRFITPAPPLRKTRAT